MNNKIFNKSLIYNQRKFFISLTLIFFIPFLISYISIAFGSDTVDKIISYMPDIFVFVLFLIFSLLVFYSNKKLKYTFFSTQPYSKNSIFFTNTLLFLISYTVPILIFGAISTILLKSNNADYMLNTFWSELISYFIVLTFVLNIIQLLQISFSTNLTIIIASILFYFLISVDILSINQVISTKLYFFKIIILKLIELNNSIILYFSLPYFKSDIPIMLLIISIIIFIISMYINKNYTLETFDNFFIVKPIKNLFKALLSIFIVILITYIFIFAILLIISILNNFLPLTNFINNNLNSLSKFISGYGALLMDIIWLVLTIFVYKLLNKFDK